MLPSNSVIDYIYKTTLRYHYKSYPLSKATYITYSKYNTTCYTHGH